MDRTARWAREAIGVRLASHLSELSALIEAIGEAKISGAPYTTFAQKKGAPAGAGGSGMALTRFVGHLGFAALAAEGRWTLNKNDQSGTLIDAIELLREFLPTKLLPPKGQHPYSTYQRILTDARFEWNLGHFEWPKVAGAPWRARAVCSHRAIREIGSCVVGRRLPCRHHDRDVAARRR